MYLTLLGITVLTQSTFYSFVTYTFPSSTNKIFVSRCRNGHIQNIIRATILLSPDLQHTDEKIHWCLHNSEAIIIRPLFGFGPIFFSILLDIYYTMCVCIPTMRIIIHHEHCLLYILYTIIAGCWHIGWGFLMLYSQCTYTIILWDLFFFFFFILRSCISLLFLFLFFV